ncbi:putative DNA repair protein YkoV [compost metagenome]
MARLLIEQLSTPFEPEKYTDDYRINLLQLIESKVAGEEISLAPARPESNVIDLMAALQASIEAVKPIATDPGPAKPKRGRTKAPAAEGAAAGGGKRTKAAAEGAGSGEPEVVTKPKRKSAGKTAKKTIS